MKEFLRVHGVEYGVVEHLTLITENGLEYEVYVNEDFDLIPGCPENEAFDMDDWTDGGSDTFSIYVEPKPEDKNNYPDIENLEFVFHWEDHDPDHVNYWDKDCIINAQSFEVEE